MPPSTLDPESERQEQEDIGLLSNKPIGLNNQASLRMAFIRKVLGLLLIQLLITFSFVVASISDAGLMKTLRGPGMLSFSYLLAVVAIVIMLVLFCVPKVARQTPLNYVLLFAFTLCETLLVGVISAHSKPKLVVMALFMTCGIVTALTLYALTTETDFTLLGGGLFVLAMALLLVGILVSFTDNKAVHVMYSGVMVFFLGLYLIFDLQLIVGGKSHELTLDDYIIAVIMLYTDIIGIFVHVLQLLNAAD